MNKSQKVVLCLVLLIILLIAWGLFPLFFKWLMVGIGSKETELKDFGAFGDIYGSLNTLFTSATLIIVVYSTYLQRQANQDAREAMEKQLQQARDDTEKQLHQAREATQQQIEHAKHLADIQLMQSMDVSKKQLELAQATHVAQIQESKDATFSNMFYALLNYKREKLNSIELESSKEIRSYKGIAILQQISSVFHIDIMKYHSIQYSTFTNKELHADFYNSCQRIFKGSISPIISYFFLYQDLIELIKKSNLRDIDKKMYQRILSNSMYQDEQIVLFWISPIFSFDIFFLHNSELINQIGLIESYKPYALKHHDETHFVNNEWKEFFRANNQPPT